jgi:hypothetical protein
MARKPKLDAIPANPHYSSLPQAASLYYRNEHNPEPWRSPEPPAPKPRAPKSDSQIEHLLPIYVELDNREGHGWRELKPGKRLQKVGELYKKKYGRDEQLGRDTERTAFVRHTVKHPAAPLRG